MAQAKTYKDFGIEVDPSQPAGVSGEVYVRCPKCEPARRHKGRKPLAVNLQKGAWYCWHCAAGGSLARGWTDDPDYADLRSRYLPPVELVAAPVSVADLMLSQVEQQRGIPRAVLEANGVRVVTRWCKSCEDRVGQIAFPYVKNGVHVHTKYRCAKKHFSTDGGTERALYQYDRVTSGDSSQPIVLTEGEFDALAVLVAGGYERVGSVPDGVQALTARRKQRENGVKVNDRPVTLPYLDDEAVAVALTEAQTVILAFDSDADGRELEAELARRLGYHRCRKVRWPEGVNDANQCLRELGPQAVRDALEGAEPYPVEGLISIADIETQLDQFYEVGLPKGVSTGWSSLDRYVTVMLGQLWVVVGLSSSGKSHWTNALVNNLAWRAAICSPEWQPFSMHAISLIETHIGKPFDRRWHPGIAMTPEEYARGKRWLHEHVTFLMPRDRTIDNLIERMKIAAVRHGTKVFVLDPWFAIQHEAGSKDYLQYIEDALTKLNEFYVGYQVLVVLVVHPTKQPAPKVNAKGEKKIVPLGLYGPSQSAAFANRADVEVEVMRVADGVTRVYVQKVRSRYQGKEGHVDLRFDPRTGRYYVIDDQPSGFSVVTPAEPDPIYLPGSDDPWFVAEQG